MVFNMITVERTQDMARPVAVLPQDEQNQLKTIRESGDLEALRARVYALRKAKWPLRAIGDPLNAPRSTVRMWELGVSDEVDLPAVPECPSAQRNRGERNVRMWLDVPLSDRTELAKLAISARKVRGTTSKTAPIRKDADKLDTMIREYTSRGVPVKRISQHMGVTPRAVAARIERYEKRQSE